MSWDPESPEQRPGWRANSVLTALRGMEFERGEIRFARGSASESLYPLQTVAFACGCVAADDNGWQSCGQGVHAVLSATDSRSRLALTYKKLRDVFDGVLLTGWVQRGGPPEHYYEYFEARSRAPFLSFETWKENHDLLGESIWQSGNLVASLVSVPGAEEIALYNGGTTLNVDLILELRSEGRYERLGPDLSSVVKTIFGAV